MTTTLKKSSWSNLLGVRPWMPCDGHQTPSDGCQMLPHDCLMPFNGRPPTSDLKHQSTFLQKQLSEESVRCQGGPAWPSDAISIESIGLSNRSNRNSQTFSNGRKIARMAWILTIFGPNESSYHDSFGQNVLNEGNGRKAFEELFEKFGQIIRTCFGII